VFNFIVRRLLSIPLVLLGVSILIFAITQAIPADVRAGAFIRSDKQIGQIPAIIKQYGLDKDVFSQYWVWLQNVVQGNLGWSSAAKRPVLEAMATYLPATLELSVLSFIPIIVIGVLSGVVAGMNRNKWPDQVGRIVSIFTYSLPTFVVGIFLLATLYGTLHLFKPGRYEIVNLPGDFPTDGFLLPRAILQGRWELVGDLLNHLVMPVLTLTIVVTGGLMRVVRSNVIDQLEQDYVRTAKAKGLEQRSVTFKHVLRNALIPVITLIGGLVYGLVTGVIITETVFNYPGIGSWAGNAALQVDIPAVIGFALFSAFAIVVINLVVDLLYGVVDPRIRYD